MVMLHTCMNMDNIFIKFDDEYDVCDWISYVKQWHRINNLYNE